MERLTTALLTGTALGAFAVAPAMAAGMHSQSPTDHHSWGVALAKANGPVGKKGLINLNGHQKTVNVPGKGVTFYDTYTYAATLNEPTTWLGQQHTIAPTNNWALVTYKSHYADHYSTNGRYYYTDTFSEHNMPNAKVKPSKDKNAKVGYKFGETESFKTFISHTYTSTTYYGYKRNTHEKYTENVLVNFLEPTYMLKKAVTSDTFDLDYSAHYTHTTTTTGKHHHVNYYNYYYNLFELDHMKF